MTPSDQPISPIVKLIQDAKDRKGKAPTEYVCENGVVLTLRKVPRQLVVDSTRKVPVPKPPSVWDEEKQRNIVNELDPSYLDAQQLYSVKTAQMTMAMYFGMGTSVKTIPDGVDGPDDDGWVEVIHEFDPDLEIPAKGTRARYVAWLTLNCLSNEDNDILFGILIGYYGATREEAVAEAMASFRGDMEGRSHNGSAPVNEDTNTHQSNSEPGVRP